ncbi:kinase-like domain-containing protein [Scleroderma yunnanense]
MLEQKFLKEAHVWSKLNHPNVLPLLGITTEFDVTVSVVSPWMKQGNAHDYVQHTAVDPRPLIEGIAKGMHYLHNHESGAIFHGDLKGANVLISDSGQALLADFGFSDIVNSSFSMPGSSHGGGKGTLRWKSPEILDGGQVSAEADVWAFGMTAFELFTREDPFHELPTISAITVRIVMGPLPGRPSTCTRLTDDWWNICSKCWVREPKSRPKMSHIAQVITKVTSLSK